MMPQPRVPKPEVSSVIVYNNQDVRGNWIPMRLEVDSWVTLQAATRGVWARDARSHGEDSNARAWKAQIKGFQWSVEAARSRGAPKLEAIMVHHAYLRRQLYLDPDIARNEPRKANYLYSSFWEDWVHPTSVLDIILVVHHTLGEATRNGRAYRELLNNGTFYLRAVYVPPSGVELFGHLEPISLPELTSPEWPLPDMHSSEAFRTKVANDFAAAMKPSTGSKVAHIQWFLPMHMMVDFFAIAAAYARRTATMYVFENVTAELLSSLMDPGWNVKYSVGQGIIKCVFYEASIKFRYHLGRQVLYANFQYVRWRTGPNQTWLPMDQTAVYDMVVMVVHFGDEKLPSFEVGKGWPVAHIREEIAIIMSKDLIPDEYDLVVERPGLPSFKVNGGSEKNAEIQQVVPPGGHFRMVPC